VPPIQVPEMAVPRLAGQVPYEAPDFLSAPLHDWLNDFKQQSKPEEATTGATAEFFFGERGG